MYDVLVVGGGPAGAAVAGSLAERGFSVLVVEDHREIGRPIQCSGLVSPAVLEMAGLLVVAEPEQFDRVNAKIALTIYQEVSLDDARFGQFVEEVRKIEGFA